MATPVKDLSAGRVYQRLVVGPTPVANENNHDLATHLNDVVDDPVVPYATNRKKVAFPRRFPPDRLLSVQSV